MARVFVGQFWMRHALRPCGLRRLSVRQSARNADTSGVKRLFEYATTASHAELGETWTPQV